MDIRIAKTRQSIINAFIEIRSHKELERITIKELCEAAQINKSTFYSHYHDIYDLSDQLENEVVTSIMDNFRCPENLLRNPAEFAKEIFIGYLAKDVLIKTLFSGSRSQLLMQKIEHALKDFIFTLHPEYREDFRFNLILTYVIYGGYYAFYQNRTYNDERAIGIIAEVTEKAMGEEFFSN